MDWIDQSLHAAEDHMVVLREAALASEPERSMPGMDTQREQAIWKPPETRFLFRHIFCQAVIENSTTEHISPSLKVDQHPAGKQDMLVDYKGHKLITLFNLADIYFLNDSGIFLLNICTKISKQ